MAEYDPPKEEPKKEEPVEEKPDLDELLAEERAKQAAREAELEKQSAMYEARMGQLETILKDRFENKTPPPETPPPVTDDDFLTPESARLAAARLAKEAALEVGTQLDQNYRGTMEQLLTDQFDTKLSALQKRKYFKYVEKDIEDAIKANPRLRMAPKALDILYDSLVGHKAEEIHEEELKESEDEKALIRTRTSVASPRSRVAAPTGTLREMYEDDKPLLTAEQEAMRQKFAKLGVEIPAERWARSVQERRGIVEDAPNFTEERKR
jgi:hypothetical protein